MSGNPDQRREISQRNHILKVRSKRRRWIINSIFRIDKIIHTWFNASVVIPAIRIIEELLHRINEILEAVGTFENPQRFGGCRYGIIILFSGNFLERRFQLLQPIGLRIVKIQLNNKALDFFRYDCYSQWQTHRAIIFFIISFCICKIGEQIIQFFIIRRTEIRFWIVNLWTPLLSFFEARWFQESRFSLEQACGNDWMLGNTF